MEHPLIVLAEQPRHHYNMEGKVDQKKKKKKKRASVPGAETSENQGETLERRHFSALPFLGSIRQKR